MRRPAGPRRRSRLLPVIAIAVLLAACESTPPVTPTASIPTSPSAAPSASAAPIPSPSATPTSSPAASPSVTPTTPPAAVDWPYRTTREIHQTLFPPDGRVVVVERDFNTERSAVVVLDAQGKPVDGWPWSIDTGNPIAEAALSPDDSLYVAQRGDGIGGADYAWKLHRLSPTADEAPGFPIDLPPVSFCDLEASATGVAYVICEAEDEDGHVTGTVLTAVSPDGSSPFTAPLRFARSVTLAGFGTDDLPIVAISRPGRTIVRALEADGTTRWSTRAIAGGAFVDPQVGSGCTARTSARTRAGPPCVPPTTSSAPMAGDRPAGRWSSGAGRPVRRCSTTARWSR